MRRRGGGLVSLCAAVGVATMISAAGCEKGAALDEGDAEVHRVTGTITYRERVALPPTAVIKVRLVDVSRADAPAVVLGEETMQASGKQAPFAFEIVYDPATIEANHSYAVQGAIEVDGMLRFVSDQHYAVITRSAANRVEMVLKSVAPPQR